MALEPQLKQRAAASGQPVTTKIYRTRATPSWRITGPAIARSRRRTQKRYSGMPAQPDRVRRLPAKATDCGGLATHIEGNARPIGLDGSVFLLGSSTRLHVTTDGTVKPRLIDQPNVGAGSAIPAGGKGSSMLSFRMAANSRNASAPP